MICSEIEMHNLLKQQQRIFLYGTGEMSYRLIKWMMDSGYSIEAVIVWHKNNYDMDSILGIPVIPLAGYMPGDNADCIIAACKEQLHGKYQAELKSRSVQNFVMLSDVFWKYIVQAYSCNLELENIILQLKTQQMLALHRPDMQRKQIMDCLRILDIHHKTFEKYRNIYKGRDIVIIAPGATLDDYQKIEGAIHIGVNLTYRKKDLKLDYLFFQDFSLKLKSREEWDVIYNELLQLQDTNLFVGQYLSDSVVEDIAIPASEMMKLNANPYILDNAPTSKIYADIRFYPLMDYYSIIFPTLHFALFTNPGRIYLVGCDVSANGYFQGSNSRQNEGVMTNYIPNMLHGYKKTLEFVKKDYHDTQIISVNPIGLRGMFQDVYTRRFLNKHPDIQHAEILE